MKLYICLFDFSLDKSTSIYQFVLKKNWSNADHIVYFAHSLIDKKDPKTRNKGCRNTIKQYLFNRLLKPVLVRNVYESVHDGTEALVFP